MQTSVSVSISQKTEPTVFATGMAPKADTGMAFKSSMTCRPVCTECPIVAGRDQTKNCCYKVALQT